MQRYFLEHSLGSEQLEITGDDAKHISRVMRMRPGDAIICCGNDGRCAKCSLQEVTNDRVVAVVEQMVDDTSEMPVRVTIAQGLPKADKLDLVVQKATELGVHRVMPFLAERSVVKWDDKKKAKRSERLRKIAKEAAEQSHRCRIPEILYPRTFDELLTESESYDVKLVAFEEEAKAGEQSNFAGLVQSISLGQSLLAVVGPEGGLSTEEVRLLQQKGFVSCGLGPRILRTETVALYMLSAISYHFELMR
ncbi:MAG TPA: 16S rRNA (uracil(1498)-N(3))-methyltransferase [Bacillales bacterium]|nr:16S rRNA (uracil(1498)-N(3))-methyltransferase [Bacillales bacterium]